MMSTRHIPQIFLLAAITFARIEAFAPNGYHPTIRSWGSWGSATQQKSSSSLHLLSTDDRTSNEVLPDTTQQAFRAPLAFVGPYPCLALQFPHLATASQRQRNATGVTLDFVLDTAANTNTVNAQVARELGLPVVGQALPGAGAAGAIPGGANTFLLGDAKLVQEPFMTGLTASALPIANPAAAGILSLAFFHCFQGGVQFDWGSGGGGSPTPASVTFYGDKSLDEQILRNRVKVSMDRIPVTQLPTIRISINGVEMPALLDTGSPITVLNEQAAKAANVETILASTEGSNNPFSSLSNRFQEAQAASRGDVLMIMGGNGKLVNLVKSKESVAVRIPGSEKEVDFGSVSLYVGELPGLAALNGLGVESPPAVVLGMDVLRQRPSMLLRARDNEVWF